MSQQRAFANRERQAQAKRLSKLGRASLMSLATVLSFGTVGLLAADQLYRPDTFVIDQLKVIGKFRHLDPTDIEAAIGRDNLGNFFSIELDAIKAKVEALPWVQEAQVRREWPNTLLVNVREHIPVMRWGKNKWVNSSGQVIDLPGEVALSNAISLSGNEYDATLILGQAFRWKKRLLESDLEVRKVELSDSHAWTLSLFHAAAAAEFKLLLGREDVDRRLTRFQFLFDKRFKYAEHKLERVDARYPDGLAIQMGEPDQTNAVAATNDAGVMSTFER